MEQIVTEINNIYNTFHSKQTKYTTIERLKGISDGYKKIIDIAKVNFRIDAETYFDMRKKSDKKLEKIQRKVLKKINKCFSGLQYDIIPASSFSAKVNVIGESDLDFMVRIKDMYTNIISNNLDDIIKFSNRLGKCGYVFHEIKSKEDPTATYYVFQKIVDGIEIEIKIRDFDGATFVAKLHDYTDNKLDKESKIYTTYIKYKLKENKEKYKNEYWKFKLIYTENAMYKTNATKLIMPLVDI